MTDAVVAFQGWNASGVGWGDDPWGESLAANPTATGAVGTVVVTANADVLVTGVVGTGQVGDVVVSGIANVPVTSVEATGQVLSLIHI